MHYNDMNSANSQTTSPCYLRPNFLTTHDSSWIHNFLTEYEAFTGRSEWELQNNLLATARIRFPPQKVDLVARSLDKLWPRHSLPNANTRRQQLFAQAALELRQGITQPVQQPLSPPPTIADLFGDIGMLRALGSRPTQLNDNTILEVANTLLVRNILSRCHQIRARFNGPLRPVIRIARLRGLICVPLPNPCQDDDFTCRIAVSGPLSLFRQSALYTQGLKATVTTIASSERFEVHIFMDPKGNRRYLLQSGDPLNTKESQKKYDSKVESRFAAEFSRAAPQWYLEREPEAIPSSGGLIFPDFSITNRLTSERWLLEIIGYWTPTYLQRKVRQYSQAGIPRLILCINEQLTRGNEQDIQNILKGIPIIYFKQSIDVQRVISVIQSSLCQPSI